MLFWWAVGVFFIFFALSIIGEAITGSQSKGFVFGFLGLVGMSAWGYAAWELFT